MVDESECVVSLENLQELEVWARAWYDEALAAEFIRQHYHPDDATLERLRRYFHAGLSPTDAANACFGQKH